MLRNIFIAFAFTTALYAQQEKDSVSDFSCINVISIKPQPLSHFFQQQYASYLHSPIYLKEALIGNFTTSSLFYNHERGDFHLAQSPEKAHNFGLNTRGLYKHKQYTFFGDLEVRRTYEDGKRWNISYNNVDENGLLDDPHYFAVSRPAAWNNQHYTLGGGVIFPLLTDLWHLQLSTRYNLQESYRTENDPRAKIMRSELLFNAQTTFRLAPSHRLSLGGEVGYANLQNRISITNKQTDSPQDYDRYLKWQLGYGTLYNRPFDSTKRRNLQYGVNLAYHYKGNFFAQLSYNLYDTDTYNNNTLNSDEQDDVLANYARSNYALHLHYNSVLRAGAQLLLTADIAQTDGYNRLTALAGKNYTMQQHYATLSVALLQQDKQHISSDAGVALTYRQTEQKDALASTESDVAYLMIKPYYSWELPFEKISVVPTFAAGVRIPVRSALTNTNVDYLKPLLPDDYAAQTTHLFYDEVVYPDSAYFAAHQYYLQFGTDLRFPVGKGRTLVVGASSHYTTDLHKKHRYTLNAHLTMQY